MRFPTVPSMSAKAVAIIAAVVASLLIAYVVRAERAVGERDLLREREKGWNTAVVTLTRALEANDEALTECRAINAANAADLAFVESQLDAVELELMLLEHAAAEERERWAHEEREWRDRADPTCRTLDDPLPDAFVDGLRAPAAPAATDSD